MDELNETMINDNVNADEVIEAAMDYNINPVVIAGIGLLAVIGAAAAVAVTKGDEIKAKLDERKIKRDAKKAEKLEKKAETIRNHYVAVEDVKSNNDEE